MMICEKNYSIMFVVVCSYIEIILSDPNLPIKSFIQAEIVQIWADC